MRGRTMATVVQCVGWIAWVGATGCTYPCTVPGLTSETVSGNYGLATPDAASIDLRVDEDADPASIVLDSASDHVEGVPFVTLTLTLPRAAGSYALAGLGAKVCEGQNEPTCADAHGSIAYRPSGVSGTYYSADIVFDSRAAEPSAPALTGTIHIEGAEAEMQETCGGGSFQEE